MPYLISSDLPRGFNLDSFDVNQIVHMQMSFRCVDVRQCSDFEGIRRNMFPSV